MKHIIIKQNRIIAFLFLLSIWGTAKGQNTDFIAADFNSYYFNPQNIGLSAPQSSDFIRYGNLQINHYNGLLNMDIELDGYKDNDFHLPMSIKYISSGFIPSKRPSTVGYNWVLNVGGAITRTVKGSPDDTKGKMTINTKQYLKDGLLVAIRNNTFVNHTEQELTNLNMPTNSKFHVPYLWGDFKYDMEPDIFNFSFGQHSGSFIIGNDGTPKCSSGKGYKIDISGISIQEYSTIATPQSSTIKITTPDGYIYEFGGNSSYLEYFIPNNPEKLAVRPRHITSWYLKSITAPNSRSILLTYESKEVVNAYNYFLYSRCHYSMWITCTNPYTGVTDPIVVDSGDDKKKDMIEVEDKVHVPVIKTMTSDNGISISFQYTLGSSFVKTTDYSLFLNSIYYYANSVKLKETTFNYTTNGNYFFLQELNKNGQKYNFNYKLSTQLPNPKTISIDHWGFWNGGYETSVSDVENYCLNMENNRNSTGSKFDIGLLTEIKYPTGGRTSVTYESNTYNRYIERNLQQVKLDLKYTNEATLCGGARVKQIIDYDYTNGKFSNSRTFNYILSETGKSSGIIGSNPKYKSREYVTWRGYRDNCDYDNRITYTDISSNTLGYNENLAEYHIGYSDVIEKFNDKSYIHYQYTSHADLSDSMESTNCRIVQTPVSVRTYMRVTDGNTDLNDIEVRERSGLYLSNDLSHFRGKLKSKIIYNPTGVIQQIESYTYNANSAKSIYNTSVATNYRGRSTYKIYLAPCLLEKKQIVDANGITQTVNYRYNNYALISEEKTTNSNNKDIAVQYTYPTDYVYSSLSIAEKSLVDKNIFNKPLAIRKFTPIDNKTLESLKLNYRMENLHPVLDNVKKLNGSTWNNLMEYVNYDRYYNPTYIIENGSLQTVYLWGYKGQHIIAQIVNASYDDVSTASLAIGLHLNGLTTTNTPTSSHFDKLNALRASIPKAQITTYKYKPLIGIESITNPRDFITHYEYDNAGRLIETSIKNKGNTKEVLDLYKYNYVNK